MPKPLPKNVVGRVCTGCGKWKTFNHFQIARSRVYGRSPRCKPCCKERNRKIPEHVRRKRYRKIGLAQYGLTLESFAELVEKQSGRCVLCLERCSKLYVDHNHHTGKVRGLLCNRCNIKLHAVEDEQFMLRARQYIRETEGYEFVTD